VSVLLLAACTHVAVLPSFVPTEVLHFRSRDGASSLLVAKFDSPGPACLVKVRQDRSPYDGLALPCVVKEDGLSLGSTRGGRPVLIADRSVTRAQVFGGPGPIFMDEVKLTVPGEVEELLATWRREVADGSLADFERFSRKREEQEENAMVAESLKGLNEKCESAVTVEIDWSTVDDQSIFDFRGRCADVMGGVWLGCSTPARREGLRRLVKSIHCRLGAQTSYTLEAGTLLATTTHASASSEQEVSEMLRSFGADPAAASPNRGPWHDGKTLDELEVLEAMKVCRDAQGHVVASGERVGLFTGTAAQLVLTPPVWQGRWRMDGWFFEPRMPRAEPVSFPTEFPGRLYSSVTFDEAKHECVVACGPRTVHAPMLSTAEGQALLLASRLAPLPFARQPHALLRDSAGTYFYADVGTEPGREHDYRLFTGTKGSMKLTRLTNVVTDSAGELYSTKSGDLKLLVDLARDSLWIVKGKARPLRRVPVEENLELIFGELGVYSGARLGTPCDDF
jgi:hypothetical protein